MHYYIKWYYWYKNFWDELLLLGVITYLVETMDMKTCTIETPDPLWLYEWLEKHTQYFPILTIDYASTIYQTVTKQILCDSLVIWWGEVITDARSFPHNWWNYLFRNYRLKFLWKKIILLWWFWEPLRFWSKLLYSLLYRWASKIICRESASYQRILNYVSKDNVLLHEDFSYSILKKVSVKMQKKKYAIVNCNPYIWSDATKEKITNYCVDGWYDRLIYFPAELTIDTPMYKELKRELPALEWFDRTHYSLNEISELYINSFWGIAARLHVLILLDYYNISYTPLVYQEKITKILWHE